MKVRVYFLKGKPDPDSEIWELTVLQKWMLENLYEPVWEAEFKNLVTPEIIAMKFRKEPEPFGIPARTKREHDDITPGDLIQIGSTYYLVLANGFKELEIPRKAKGIR